MGFKVWGSFKVKHISKGGKKRKTCNSDNFGKQFGNSKQFFNTLATASNVTNGGKKYMERNQICSEILGTRI